MSTLAFDIDMSSTSVVNASMVCEFSEEAPPPARFVRRNNKRRPQSTEVSDVTVMEKSDTISTSPNKPRSDVSNAYRGSVIRTSISPAYYQAHRKHALTLEESDSKSSPVSVNEQWDEVFSALLLARTV